MAKKIKKGKKGSASKFMSRSRAIKRLGLPIKDFRKLCILKGVHPREPRKKLANTSMTYYHVKDIRYLESEKTLDYFKTFATYKKKLKKAIGRRDMLRIAKLKEEKPELNLQHIVKERYPNLEEALRDLDDPLTMISLASKFPGHRLFNINPETLKITQLLLDMFKAVVMKESLLEKVFLSIKGIYYQVIVKGVRITWIEPYPFTHTLPFDVDYKVIQSFSEFYRVLLKFVVFKLYKNYNLVYPPQIINEEDQDVSRDVSNFSY